MLPDGRSFTGRVDGHDAVGAAEPEFAADAGAGVVVEPVDRQPVRDGVVCEARQPGVALVDARVGREPDVAESVLQDAVNRVVGQPLGRGPAADREVVDPDGRQPLFFGAARCGRRRVRERDVFAGSRLMRTGS